MKFRKQGPKFLEDMHIIFDKAHVSGSSATCPGDISSDEASDEDVEEVPKRAEAAPKRTKNAGKTGNQGKKKRKGASTAIEDKDEKSPFFRMYKNTCLKIETAAEKISTSIEASSAPPTNLVPSIAQTVNMVIECGVEEGTALMHTASSLIRDQDFREFFCSLKTNKGRLDLTERESMRRRC